MSAEQPIGVFDSGIGGLTVLDEIHRALPWESTVYFGDVARCPYGPRPRDEVRRFAVEITRFLATHHPLKMLVIACNTASAAAFRDVQDVVPHLSVVGVIEPGARTALRVSGTKRIGVMATAGTVRSNAYRAAILGVDPTAIVVEEACPHLVPLVEAGQTDSEEAEFWVRHYLEPLWAAQVDTLILGCTHYPLLRPVIERVTAGRVAIVDSAHTTAASVHETLHMANLLVPPGLAPRRLFYTTGSPGEFQTLAQRLLHLSLHDVRAACLPDGYSEVATGVRQTTP